MIIRSITHHALEALCAQASEAVVVVDAQGCIALFNPAAEAALGLCAAEVVGRLLSDCAVLQPLAARLGETTDNGQGAIRALLPLASGEQVPVQVIVLLDGMPAAGEDLVENLVHDLKLPAAMAKNFIDVVQEAGELNAQQLDFANRARLKMLTMVDAINEVIDTFWMNASGRLHLRQTDLVPIIRKIEREAGDLARLRGVTIELDLPADGCTVLVDSTRIRNAISNLVNNAIKYSLNGGTVRIALTQEPGSITCQVADQGIGIAAEELERIFERGYRVRSKETDRIEGTGAGLAIVKTIVEKHGGKVFVSSTPGEGSVFGFTLPTA
ncbi:MAG: PAS domain-containing protein [Anaerolineae bacterium]|nr:PAS domain-containing protein [Anaerolineae bacterium]